MIFLRDLCSDQRLGLSDQQHFGLLGYRLGLSGKHSITQLGQHRVALDVRANGEDFRATP